MAKIVFKDASITVDGTDLSDHGNEITIEDTADEADFTSFGSGYKELGQGLKDATITATFFQDFAASSVHSVLQPLYASGGTFNVVVKAGTAATSATNPAATMTARLFSYGGIAGAVGDALTVEASFRNAGDGVTWATV